MNNEQLTINNWVCGVKVRKVGWVERSGTQHPAPPMLGSVSLQENKSIINC